MKIRNLESRDMAVLRSWHEAAGFDYPLPDFTIDPNLYPEVTLLVDEEDIPVLFIGAKAVPEMFVLMNPNWRNPRWRLEALMQSHEDMRQRLLKRGFEDVTAFLPPEVERSFGRKLQKIFNWIPGRWKHYSLRLEGNL